MDQIGTRAHIVAALDDLKATGAELDGLVVRLLTGAIPENDDAEWADVTEAAFTGYAASAAITWGAAFYSQDAQMPLLTGDLKTFTCSADPGEDITGWAITTSGGTPVLKRWGTFEEAVAIVAGGQIKILPQALIPTVEVLAEVQPIVA